jgi:hypothetical protein
VSDVATTNQDSAYDQVGFASSAADRALDMGGGVVRLAPAWVPREFCTPGRRIRLHPDDYFPFGPQRGGVDERWLASAIRADNGPLTGPYEGLSLVVDPEGGLLPFDEFVGHHKAALIGARLWDGYGRWPMYSKFFDNLLPLPFHFHHRDEHAALVGKLGKPESYYYSPHMNNTLGQQSISFFGLQPETTRAQLREKLERFADGGDNRITDLSHGYRTQLGTGWDIPSGVLHAPGSVCTYEPQAASDVFVMCESWSNNREVPEELIWKDVPADKVGDFDFIIELLDWDLNADPNFKTNRFMTPHATAGSAAFDGRAEERWVVFRSDAYSASELSVEPGQTVTVTDTDAYGLIVVQGFGSIGTHQVEAATVIRFGELSSDEFFVSEAAATAGVEIVNHSSSQPLVILKHFGPGNRALAASQPAA